LVCGEIRAENEDGGTHNLKKASAWPGLFSAATLTGVSMQQKSGVSEYIEPELKVEVAEDARALIITLPGTDYEIKYRKLADIPGISGAHDLLG
jgi:hypothetical protein